MNCSSARDMASGSEGGTSRAFRPSPRTSVVCPKDVATIGRPIAMYSKSFVGEPKKSEPSGLGTVGNARMSHAAR